jgi:hypothetical protein
MRAEFFEDRFRTGCKNTGANIFDAAAPHGKL